MHHPPARSGPAIPGLALRRLTVPALALLLAACAAGPDYVHPKLAFVPTAVVPDGGSTPVPLGEWQDSVLHDLCFNTIFPDYYSTFASAGIGTFGAEMVEGGMSQDSGRAPAPALGDFPAAPACVRWERRASRPRFRIRKTGE